MATFKLPAWATKKVGPLPVWGWIIAGIVGILLGLYLRRFFATRGEGGGEAGEVVAGPWSQMPSREGIGIVGSDTTPEPPPSDIATPTPQPAPLPELITIEVPTIIEPTPTPSLISKLKAMPGYDYVRDNLGVHFIVRWSGPNRYRISGGLRDEAREAFGSPLTKASEVPVTYRRKMQDWQRRRGIAVDMNGPIYLDASIIPWQESPWTGQGIVGGIPA